MVTSERRGTESLSWFKKKKFHAFGAAELIPCSPELATVPRSHSAVSTAKPRLTKIIRS